MPRHFAQKKKTNKQKQPKKMIIFLSADRVSIQAPLDAMFVCIHMHIDMALEDCLHKTVGKEKIINKCKKCAPG